MAISFVFWTSKWPVWSKHFPVDFRLDLYVFGFRKTKRMGIRTELIKSLTFVFLSPPSMQSKFSLWWSAQPWDQRKYQLKHLSRLVAGSCSPTPSQPRRTCRTRWSWTARRSAPMWWRSILTMRLWESLMTVLTIQKLLLQCAKIIKEAMEEKYGGMGFWQVRLYKEIMSSFLRLICRWL